MNSADQVRSLLLPSAGGLLLLPNAMVAEVLTFRQPSPLADAPAWALGVIEWRERRVPVISLDLLWGDATEAPEQPGSRARLAVCHTLAEQPYTQLALHVAGMPRLLEADRSSVVRGDAAGSREFVLADVAVNDQPAIIPDLKSLAAALAAQIDSAT